MRLSFGKVDQVAREHGGRVEAGCLVVGQERARMEWIFGVLSLDGRPGHRDIYTVEALIAYIDEMKEMQR